MNTQILKGYDKYILFGTNTMGVQALKQLRQAGIEVAYFCDNDKNKWGTAIDGVCVIPPDVLAETAKRTNALIIICSGYAKHVIAAQLEEIDLPYVYFSKPIFVEITSFCNQACIFCPYEYIERKKSTLDVNLMKSFLHDLKSEKSDVLYPTLYPHVLGEPLTSKHLFDFLDTCKELGFYVCLVTNWALMDEKIQQRIFTEYPDLDIVFSMQGASEKVFHWRKEKRLSYQQWVDRLFEIMEGKFKYAHRGLMQICTIYPDVANKLITRSDSDLHLFEWYDDQEEFSQWKRDFGGRCVAFDQEMRQKYPENYEAVKNDASSPISYYYILYRVIKDFEEWVNIEGPSQFEFAPNIHIYEKKFGVWGVEKYFKALLPEDKFFYWEENWHVLIEKCDRVGDVSLLSNGQLVSCNIDNEADFVFADLNKGEKYSDEKTQSRIRELRDNLTLSPLCRRCKSRALVFDTSDIEALEQPIIHFGIRWHAKRENELGEIYRVSYELSQAFVYPRIEAAFLNVELASVQDKQQYTLLKILSYDEASKCFTERKNYTVILKPQQRKEVSVPFNFEKKTLYRIDFITATQRNNGIDDGVALYAASLKK